MSLREKYFVAMCRLDDAYVPFDFRLCPALHEEFKQRTREGEYWEYYRFPVRDTVVEYVGERDKFLAYYPEPTDIEIDDWGVGHENGNFTKMHHPMENFQTLAQSEAYPYPDPVSDYDWGTCPGNVKAIQERDLVVVARMRMTIFEIAWYLRGMATFLMDLLLDPTLVMYHLDRITAIRCETAKQYAAAGCDVLSLGDDVSTQLGMMMSVATWRKFLKPRLAKVIQAARSVKPDMLIFYHGDGNLSSLFLN